MRQKLLDLEKRYELFEKTIADIKHRNNSKGFKTLLDHHKNPSAKAQSHKAAGNEYETSRSLNIPTSQLGQNPLSKTDDALNQPNFDKIRGDPEDEGKGRDTKLAADEDRE